MAAAAGTAATQAQTQAQQQQMAQATARIVDIERQRIQQALKRIKEDNFGYCLICDEEMSEKRLNFDPSLPICVECAEEAEKRRR